MKVIVIGTGYVGLVSGTCFSEMGVDVTCVDIDVRKITMLREGEVPIYEPGLAELIQRNVAAGRLHFTTQLSECLAEAELVNKLSSTVDSLNEVLTALDTNEGSVGMLLHDAQLYNKLTTAGDNLGLLLEDLKANPMRYVHFSLFGTSDEKMLEKQAKKAAREEKRAAKQNK